MVTILSDKKLHKIGRINQIIREYFESNPSISEIEAKELMPVFIDRGIFYKNHCDGTPICNLLRGLDKESKLFLLKHVKVTKIQVNRKWYFTRQ